MPLSLLALIWLLSGWRILVFGGLLVQMTDELSASQEFTILLEQVELSGAVAMSFVRGYTGAELPLLNILFLQ